MRNDKLHVGLCVHEWTHKGSLVSQDVAVWTRRERLGTYLGQRGLTRTYLSIRGRYLTS